MTVEQYADLRVLEDPNFASVHRGGYLLGCLGDADSRFEEDADALDALLLNEDLSALSAPQPQRRHRTVSSALRSTTRCVDSDKRRRNDDG